MGGVDSLSIPLRFPSRRTGTRDDAKNGPDAHRLCCVPRSPGRSTATWLAMEELIRWFTVSFLVQLNLRWRVFFRASHHVCINDTRKCNKCQTFFAKIVKMLTINLILHEFRFFVTVFLRKIVKTVTFSRKIDKNFKTGVIVAHFDFFVKKSLMIQLS